MKIENNPPANKIENVQGLAREKTENRLCKNPLYSGKMRINDNSKCAVSY